MSKHEPINTFPIQNFISQVKSAEQSNAKEVKISIDQAKNLVYCLGLVTSRLTEDLEKLLINSKTEENIEIQINSNSSW